MSNKTTHDLIFISHFFPPTGGSGVQRSSKFFKYLPDLGYQPLVICSSISSPDRWTPNDSSLASDLNTDQQVFRLSDSQENRVINNTTENKTRTENIVQTGIEISRHNSPRIVYVSLSPFGDISAASIIAKKLKIPCVADLRDPWALDEFQTYRSFYHRIKETKTMGDRLRPFNAIIMNTPTARDLLLRKFPFLDPQKVYVITNGYDQEDFENPIEAPPLNNNLFNIVHTGTFHSKYAEKQRRTGLLNFILGRNTRGVKVSGRTPKYILDALNILRTRNPNIFDEVRVCFAGVESEADRKLVEQSGMGSKIDFTGYLTHDLSVQHLMSAQLLFLPLHKMPAGRKSSIVPGKTYEYMASGKPIIGALPEGDARDFVETYGRGTTCAPDDAEAMHDCIVNEFTKWKKGEEDHSINRKFVAEFERRKLSTKLSAIFDSLIQN